MDQKRRVLFVVNAEWYFVSHRLSLARSLKAQGYDVVVASGVERGADAIIEAEGIRFVRLNLRRRSLNPLRELATFREIYRLYRSERPDIVHHVTLKPVVYGSLAARLAGVPRVINAITGMGVAFEQPSLKGMLLRRMLSFALRLACMRETTRVIFQNPQDRDWFVTRRLVPERRTALIRGSGVDIRRFTPGPADATVPVVMLASRLLWEKGVGEFVDASRRLRTRGLRCRFVLVGAPDDEHPRPIPVTTLEEWQDDDLVEWWGLRNDMPDVLRSATIVTLPTNYPEGVPKVLLEAAACGRAVIATDVPGCREIVVHEETGLLVKPRDAGALSDAIQRLLSDAPLRERLGENARRLAVDQFSEERTIAATSDLYRELLGAPGSVEQAISRPVAPV